MPTTKNVAGTCSRANTAKTCGVQRGSGPSSNVSATVRDGRPWDVSPCGPSNTTLPPPATDALPEPEFVRAGPTPSVNPCRHRAAKIARSSNVSVAQCARGNRRRTAGGNVALVRVKESDATRATDPAATSTSDPPHATAAQERPDVAPSNQSGARTVPQRESLGAQG